MARRGFCSALAMGLALFGVAPVAAQDVAFEPLPPPPPYESREYIEPGLSPQDAAARAIGTLADSFVDRAVSSPPPASIKDLWTVVFLSKPRLLRPGLCSERSLGILMLRRRPSKEKITWQAFDRNWSENYRIVGSLDPAPSQASRERQEAACAELGPFKNLFGDRTLAAPSPESAWQGGQLPTDALRHVGPCDSDQRFDSCIALDVSANHPVYSSGYWNLEVRRRGDSRLEASSVTMDFQIPPIT